MSTPVTNLVVSQLSTQAQLVDQSGHLTPYGQRAWSDLIRAVNGALNILGQFNGTIGPDAVVAGHLGTLQDTVQHLSATGTLVATALTGIVAATQLPAALTTQQGAVQLPAGASSNVLGSAALSSTTDFDAAGSAATAQSNAETFATAGDVTTLASAKTYTDGKFTSGLSVTIVTAQLTPTGAQGSMTFTNGLLTAQTPAT